MSNPRRTLQRYETPSHARFLTFSCYRRLDLFKNDAIKDVFVDGLMDLHARRSFALFAWVVMPNHVHLLLTLDEDDDVPSFLRRLKPAFAKTVLTRWAELDAPILSKIQDKSGRTRFWQPGGGYDRNIFTRDEFAEKVRYIHDNPVRAGLVEKATEYRWSSAPKHAGLTQDGPALGSIRH